MHSTPSYPPLVSPGCSGGADASTSSGVLRGAPGNRQHRSPAATATVPENGGASFRTALNARQLPAIGNRFVKKCQTPRREEEKNNREG